MTTLKLIKLLEAFWGGGGVFRVCRFRFRDVGFMNSLGVDKFCSEKRVAVQLTWDNRSLPHGETLVHEP